MKLTRLYRPSKPTFEDNITPEEQAAFAPSETISHALLKAKKDNGGLEAGKYYLISDFQTIHQIPFTTEIHTETIEPIIVLATSTHTLSKEAYSTLYPQDILHYDLDNVLCEDGVTARKGFILRRIDTEKILEI